jgi:hypothetical protein
LAVILFCSEKFWITLNMAVTRLMTQRLPGGRRSMTRRMQAMRHSTGSAIALIQHKRSTPNRVISHTTTRPTNQPTTPTPNIPLAAMKALYNSNVRMGLGNSTKNSLSTPATVCALVSLSRCALRPVQAAAAAAATEWY